MKRPRQTAPAILAAAHDSRWVERASLRYLWRPRMPWTLSSLRQYAKRLEIYRLDGRVN